MKNYLVNLIIIEIVSLVFNGRGNATTVKPYTYCTRDSCFLIHGTQNLFFGPLPESVVRICKKSNMYAMTFDDGPTEAWDKLLNLLSEYQVKATFFINGSNLANPANQARVLKAHRLGHQISNHSTHHSDFLKHDNQTILAELDDTKNKIIEILGNTDQVIFSAKVARPPFGYADKRIADIFATNGYIPVRWNSDRYDWQLGKNDSSIYLKRFNQHIDFIRFHSGSRPNTSILDLNHDRSQATFDSLPVVIKSVREMGYSFVTLNECIGK